MLVTGVGPILAPQIGAEILQFTSWRGIFLALALIASVLLVTALFKTPETLPPERRRAGGLRSTMHILAIVSSDRSFVGYMLVSTLGFGAIFAYIAGSPFVLQNIYGLSPQIFGLVFAMNAVGLVLGAQINGHLVRRLGSRSLLTFGLIVMAFGATIFLGAASTHWLGLSAVLPPLFMLLFGLGFVSPNAMALAGENAKPRELRRCSIGTSRELPVFIRGRCGTGCGPRRKSRCDTYGPIDGGTSGWCPRHPLCRSPL